MRLWTKFFVAFLTAIAIGLLILAFVSRGVSRKTDAADKKIEKLLESEEYVSASTQDRQKIAAQLLANLLEDECISHLLYDKDTALFSFRYADGTQGGLYIRDFSDCGTESNMNLTGGQW